MANYPQYGYPQPPYNQPAYPPQPYAQQHYGQPPYGQNQYAPVPYGQPGYPTPDPNYPQYHDPAAYHEGYPSKKHKINAGNQYQQQGYPTAQQQHGYPTPSPYPPQVGYQQPAMIPPPPPPGWLPPPPPNWRGPVQPAPQAYPPAPNYQQPHAYPPAGHYPQHASSQHAPYQQQAHVPYNHYPTQNNQHQNNSKHHNQAQHFNNTQFHGGVVPRSRVWIRPPDTAATQKSVVPPATPSFNGQVGQPQTSGTAQSSATPAPNPVLVASTSAKKTTKSNPTKLKNLTGIDASDWEWDDYWYGEDEKIDPDFSLGEIVWHPADRTGRAIPSNWDDAEQWCESLPGPLEKESNETVSRYASADDVERDCRSTKETRQWLEVQDDPAFVDLSSDNRMIPLERAIANRHQLPSSPEVPMDLDSEEGEITSYSAEYSQNLIGNLQTALGYSNHDDDKVAPQNGMSTSVNVENAEVIEHGLPVGGEEDDDEDEAYSPPPVEDTIVETIESKVSIKQERQSEDPAGSLDRNAHNVAEAACQSAAQIKIEAKPLDAVAGHKLPPKPEIVVGYNVKKPIPKTSGTPEQKTMPRVVKLPPKPTVDFIKDDTQEDILARLGVTGAPKPAMGVPGPAYKPPPVDNTAAAIQSMIVTSFPVPPPPPMPDVSSQKTPEPEIDDNPWTSGYDGSRDSPRSQTSQHTLAGSDFPIDESVNNSPELKRLNGVAPVAIEKAASKKRKVAPSEQDEKAENPSKNPKDDISSRLRTRRPKVAAAYSRRW